MKKLAGIVFIRNGIEFDYSYKECIQSLLEFCDYVYVLDAGSDDGTYEDLISMLDTTDKMTLIRRTKKEWDEQIGKKKLSYFTNIAIEEAEKDGYEYVINIQADEILHERSYKAVHEAIETGKEAFMCKRINLWRSPYMQLNVTHDRLPCSTEIIRLAKSNYRSIDDAESICAQANFDFLDKIDIFHYGFVRDKKIMKKKVINMQENVFQLEHDKKLDGTDVFEPDRWFDPKKDLKVIDYPHPKIMQEWILHRP